MALRPPEVAETDLTFKNLYCQYLHNEERYVELFNTNGKS